MPVRQAPSGATRASGMLMRPVWPVTLGLAAEDWACAAGASTALARHSAPPQRRLPIVVVTGLPVFYFWNVLPGFHHLFEREFDSRRAPDFAHPPHHRLGFLHPIRMPGAVVEHLESLGLPAAPEALVEAPGERLE